MIVDYQKKRKLAIGFSLVFLITIVGILQTFSSVHLVEASSLLSTTPSPLNRTFFSENLYQTNLFDRLSANPGSTGQQALAGPNASDRLYLPLVRLGVLPTATTTPPSGASEKDWTQHAHDAQRTSFTDQVVATPWRWKWAWNGPNASGGISSGKFGLPRNSQPVTGGGRVYIAAGSRGVYALDNSNGSVAWNRNPGGNINSTPAYDNQTQALFVVSSNGTLYKLDAATGNTLGQFATGATSSLPLPPAILSDRVLFSMGNRVYAVSTTTLTQIWAYDAGSPVHTPPAYSPSRNRVIAVSQDLYVHAINNSNGTRVWRVKPTPLTAGDPGQDTNYAESKNGWPVIAESHGYVLIKLRLDWQTLWTWNPWPSTNSAMRTNLTSRPDQQALFALKLDDGASAFIANVGHGGFGDGGYMPMGPQPVVKRFENGQEVAYVVMRGSPCGASPCDGRWDSHLGEMLLDNTTVSGYQAGDVRFMNNTFFPTDEQANISMSGDQIFGGHWMFGIAHQITDRSASKGSGTNPIGTTNLPHIITSASNCGFSASHYCANSLTQDGDPRTIPGGFYIYYNQGGVYDQYWSEYATWVVSNKTIYYVSTDGAVVALESGNPTAAPVSGSIPSVNAFANQPMLSDTTFKLFADASVSVNNGTNSVNDILPYTQARDYVGKTVTVEGTIKYLFNNYLAVYLGFENPHQGAFKVRILKEHWGNFSASPETIYRLGQRIRVTGTIRWYQGDPAIYAADPMQIQVIDP